MAYVAGAGSRLGRWSRSRARFVFAAAGRRLGARPRLATSVVRLPGLFPEGRVRSGLYRRFSWPIAKRLGAEAEVAVVAGSTMVVRTTDTLGRVLAVSGVWEPNVTAVFMRSLAPGDVCVDVGAHIGYYTLLASKLVGRDGHVYAFEPSPPNYDVLRANLERNRAENVTAFDVAAGEAAGSAVLYEGPGTNTGRATLNPLPAGRAGQHREVRVDVRPVAASIPNADLGRVRTIKIDVEGSELEVLRSLAPIFELGERLAVFVELTPGWTGAGEAARLVESVCAAHRFKLFRLNTGYSLDHLFPSTISPPEELASVPPEQCDLLLTRTAP